MRKIAAIFFLSVLCFNCVGYRYVFDYLEKNHSRQLNARLDNEDYDETSLISIKTSFSVPYSYLHKSDKFERWNGEIEIDGIKYNYVKRRFFGDSIELLCIPNMAATSVNAAKHDFFKSANDLQANHHGNQDQGKLPGFKSLLSEYCEQVPDWNVEAIPSLQIPYATYSLFISQFIGDTPCQPPDIA